MMKRWIVLLLAMAFALQATACACQKKPETQPLTGTMEELVGKIMEENPAQFMGGTTPLDLQDTTEEGLWALKSYTGLASAASITDGAVYEPMTGSQAFSLVLVRVAENADAKTVAQTRGYLTGVVCS